MPPDAPAIALSLSGVGMTFGGVSVLRDISVDFRAGEIHGLIGENGAGKSTLGKIAGGFYRRSTGMIRTLNKDVQAWDPPTALAMGVAIMHQELQIVPSLTVAQNIFLGIENTRAGLLRRDESARMAKVTRQTGFALNPGMRAGSLGTADQQKVEIMRALVREARVIVMDEPTSALTEDEAQRLHQTMKRLRDQGRCIIYVTHFIGHVLENCDRVTILRDGNVVRTSDIAGETKASLIADMLGKPSGEIDYPRLAPAQISQSALLVRDLTAASGIRNVSIEIGKGEVVGLVGLVGSGRSEIARAIFGAGPPATGSVEVSGQDYADRTPSASIARKLVMVPEDRRAEGLFLAHSVRSNISLPYLDKFARGVLIDSQAERRTIAERIARFRIVPDRMQARIGNLSGGNQQKALLARWTLDDPEVVILDDPSRGVDIGARRQIHDFILELAAKGAGVLLISSEIEEVLQLSHRIYLVRKGEIAGMLDPRGITTEQVIERLAS